MEIVEGIHKVDEASSNMAHSNIYLLINGKELIVVDTGTPRNAKKIVDYVEKLGRQPNEVSTIILTHYHMDHTGSVKDLKDLTGAKVAASQEDAQYITGKQSYPKPKGILFRAASSFIKITPVPVDIVLKDGDATGGLTVIFTPGHTPGSIMLLDKKRKVLFSGDSLRVEGGKVTVAPRHFTWDESKEKESIKKVAALDFDILLPGHADYLKGNASAVVRAFANQ
jgi:glyoxylase-like metal-dependent hydrolase (beta-lactamase superfamily II)